jgi:hypothetical protein
MGARALLPLLLAAAAAALLPRALALTDAADGTYARTCFALLCSLPPA